TPVVTIGGSPCDGAAYFLQVRAARRKSNRIGEERGHLGDRGGAAAVPGEALAVGEVDAGGGQERGQLGGVGAAERVGLVGEEHDRGRKCAHGVEGGLGIAL